MYTGIEVRENGKTFSCTGKGQEELDCLLRGRGPAVMSLAVACTSTLGAGRFRSQVHPRPGGCPEIPRTGLVEGQLLRDRSKQFSHVGG